jgi:hypothetical protein
MFSSPPATGQIDMRTSIGKEIVLSHTSEKLYSGQLQYTVILNI